jgi:hypothetical protein
MRITRGRSPFGQHLGLIGTQAVGFGCLMRL